MFASSDWKTGQCIEWRTELPNACKSRESPVFLFQDVECYFQFSRISLNTGYVHRIHLKQKNAATSTLKPFSLAVHVASQRLCDIDVTCLTISDVEKYPIWSISERDLQSILKINFYNGFLLKLVFIFDSSAAPTFPSIKSETDDKSVQTSSPLPDNRLNSKSCLEYLSDDFSKLLDVGVDCDVDLKCGEVTIGAHRTVIGARSSVFAAMLTTDMVEGRTGLVELEQGMDAGLFRDFVRHLYAGTMPELNEERAAKLYDVGDKYAVESLKRHCAIFLIEHLTPANACERLALADAHSDYEFKESVLAYVLNNKVPLLGDQWLAFCHDQPLLAIQVLNRSYQLSNTA